MRRSRRSARSPSRRRRGSRSCCRPRTRSGWRRSSRGGSGLPSWQFALTATDANRFAIRLARHVTGRPKILVFNWCYHGTVDETFATLVDGRVERAARQPRPAGGSGRDDTRRRVQRRRRARAGAGARGRGVRARRARADEHRHRPSRSPGFHDALRELTRRHGTLLVIDETHTICCGPGGYTAAHGLEPDIADDRQADRRRHPGGRVRLLGGARRAHRRRDRARGRSTSAASAGRSPATRSRWRRCAPRSARC